MRNLSKADMNFLMGNGPTAVSSKPMVRQQGNGNYTGMVRTHWSDGTTSDAEFVVNAETIYEVQQIYLGRSA